jgi:hypothetical protein
MVDLGEGRDSPSPAQVGWELVQIGEIVRVVEDLVLSALTTLGPSVHAGIAEGEDIVLGDTAVVEVLDALDEIADLADRLRILAGDFPRRALCLSYPDARDGAVAELSTRGIHDPRRLLVAARLLDTTTGWPSLADALTRNDMHESLGDLTLAELLGAFRGARSHLIRRSAEHAGLSPDQPVSSCSPEKLAQVAFVLGAHGGER